MGFKDISSRDAVVKAIEEFDSLGRDQFLAKYGFHHAKSYYLVFRNHRYDAKAIVGVAHGYQFPSLGPLNPSAFTGGEPTVSRLLQRLGFTVRDDSEANSDTPIVLVENEATAGGRYDFWEDVTGERYHFPNQYRNLVVPGRPFVYYRGVRRLGGRRERAEYFGHGRIALVWIQTETMWGPAQRRRWFTEIEDYEPFPQPVPARLEGQFIEDIPRNHWGVAVRVLGQEAYNTIIRLAGLGVAKTLNASLPPEMPLLAEVKPELEEKLDGLLLPPSKASLEGYAQTTVRRSRYSKQVGDRAEAIVYEYLQDTLRSGLAQTLKWHAREGETPGWDMSYDNASGHRILVEVKGTNAAAFPSIELTAGEWLAAQNCGDRYWLYLVARCLTTKPVIQPIQNPAKLVSEGKIDATPTNWRMVLL